MTELTAALKQFDTAIKAKEAMLAQLKLTFCDTNSDKATATKSPFTIFYNSVEKAAASQQASQENNKNDENDKNQPVVLTSTPGIKGH